MLIYKFQTTFTIEQKHNCRNFCYNFIKTSRKLDHICQIIVLYCYLLDQKLCYNRRSSINNISQTTYFLSRQMQYTSKYIQEVLLSIEYYFLIINLCKSSKILLASIGTKCVENHCYEKTPHQTIMHEYYFLWQNLCQILQKVFFNE